MDICYKIVDAVKADLKLDKLEVKLNPVNLGDAHPADRQRHGGPRVRLDHHNVERQKQVAFTNTHFLTANRFVAKKSSGLTKFEDLKGKTVVSTSGTTNIKQINEYNARRSSASRSCRPRTTPRRS